LGGFVLLLFVALPAIVVGSILYPFYAVGRFRILAREGEGDRDDEFRRRWGWFAKRTVLLAYILFVIAFTLPDVLPRFRALLESGRLYLVVLPVLLDMVLANVFSQERALRRFERRGGTRKPKA
jgi:hypothetical protein